MSKKYFAITCLITNLIIVLHWLVFSHNLHAGFAVMVWLELFAGSLNITGLVMLWADRKSRRLFL